MRVFFDCDVLLPESERSVKPPTFISFFIFEDYIDRGFGLSASSSSSPSPSVGPPSGKGRMGYIHTYIHTHTRIYIHRALTVYVEIRSRTY